jgi:hypothetical protein
MPGSLSGGEDRHIPVPLGVDASEIFVVDELSDPLGSPDQKRLPAWVGLAGELRHSLSVA